MKIDFHVHTSNRSSCARSDEILMIEQAIASGLDAVAITDHNLLVPPDRLAALNSRYAPFQILHGVEVVADQEDWLVLGARDRIYQREDWSYPDLWRQVRSAGDVLVLAHPFRYHATVYADLQHYPPDAIESQSNNIRPELVSKIHLLAESLGLPTLVNSDAHHTSSLGKYFNYYAEPWLSEDQIFAKIRKFPVLAS